MQGMKESRFQALSDRDDDFAEKLRRFETQQLQMGRHLRDYGVRAGNQSQFPHGQPQLR